MQEDARSRSLDEYRCGRQFHNFHASGALVAPAIRAAEIVHFLGRDGERAAPSAASVDHVVEKETTVENAERVEIVCSAAAPRRIVLLLSSGFRLSSAGLSGVTA